MRYTSLLRHRADLLRMEQIKVGGLAGAHWVVVESNVRCFLDLTFIRKGRDPIWTAQGGRPSERNGVLFMHPNTDIRSGDRVRMTRGPAGTFQIEGALDEAWRPTSRHHLELGCVEVGSPLAKGTVPNPSPQTLSAVASLTSPEVSDG